MARLTAIIGAISWRQWLALVALLGVMNGAWWTFYNDYRWYEGTDSEEYRLLAHNMLDGHGFSRERSAPYVAAAYREPGYPVFLAAIFAVTGRSDNAAAAVQVLILGLTAAGSAHLGLLTLGNRAGAIAGGALVALSPDLGDHARYEFSEAIYVPLLVLAVLVTYRAQKVRTVRSGLLAGLAWAAAGYVRVISFPTAVALAITTVLAHRLRGPKAWAVAMVSVALLLSLPWIARNTVEVGRPLFTGRTGAFLIPRGDQAAAPFKTQISWAQTSVWALTYPVSALFVPTEKMHEEGYPLWQGPLGELELVSSTRSIMERGKLCPANEAVMAHDDCLAQQSIGLILTHLPQYLALMPVEFVRLTFYIYPSKLGVAHNLVIWLGLITLVACLARSSLRTEGRIWLALVIFSFTAPSLIGSANPRLGVPLVPFYSLFAGLGVILAVEWMARRLGLRELQLNSPPS
jgi:hypothetical protein